jgi:hypothetical protein
MNLRKKFSKKPWESNDAETRANAVRDLNEPELQAALPELAQHDESATVRKAALERIDTEPFWLDARLRESDSDILQAADRYLARAVLKSDDDRLETARLEWFGLINDDALIRKVAASAPSIALRRAALARIQSQGFLGDCYATEPDDELAAAILSRIEQTSTLERIATALRSRNKRRYRAATGALEQQLSGRGEAEAGQAASERLVHEAERLARGEFSGDPRQLIEELKERWQVEPTHPETLALRFDSALRIAEAARQRPARESVSPETSTAHDDAPQDAADTELAAAADQIRTQLAQGTSVDPSTLLASWDRSWNRLSSVGAADEQLKQDMLPLLRDLQARVQQQRNQTEHRESAQEPVDQKDQVPDLTPDLDRIADVLEAGDIRQADERIRELRKIFDRLPARRRPGAIGGRLQRMEGRLKEMRNWQHWSNNKLRDELITQVEALPESGQHPDAISAALKRARTEWRRLETLELLPSDKRRFAAPSGQWRRFQTACKGAFDSARPYFEKRQELQQENLETLKAFIEAGQAAAAKPDAESSELLGFVRKARQAIRRVDDLPTKKRGPSAAALRELMDLLSNRLDETFERVESTKRRLVTEAKALTHEKDLKIAIDKAKALQQQWQRAGSGRRKVEQQLWREFREPIDPLFKKLKGEQSERKAADQQAMAELEALCVRAEELAGAADDEIEGARSQFGGLVRQWLTKDGRPPRLNQRFERAEERLEQRLKSIQNRAQNRRDEQLWNLAAVVQELWTRRCGGDQGDLGEIIPDTDESDKLVAGLLERARTIADASADQQQLQTLAQEGLAAGRQVAVEMEFLSGLDTPASDQQLRMDYQVQRLARRMGERQNQPDLASEAESLKKRWLRSLPHPPQDHEALLPRFRRAREIVEGMIGTD